MVGNSYLLERQRDLARLKRLALEEFVFARNSGRLVAFVGSYATKHMGYPDWKEMVRTFLEGCKAVPSQTRLVKNLESRSRKSEEQFAALDIMDMAELLADRDRHTDEKNFQDHRENFAKSFELKGLVADGLTRPRIAEALLARLNISRIVTLNYDLEIEWEAFLTEHQRVARLTEARQTVWDWLGFTPGARLMELDVPGRGRVTSDVLEREDSAQLIEFALGAANDEVRQILHLHGRRDHPDSMLVTRRDYRDRYWQEGFSKLPFEYGLRLIYSGNPILFVGIGMTELEVTRTLEQMLSDNPNRRAVPMFLLWNASEKRSRERDDVTRLLFNRKFGVHVLFDYEIADRMIPRIEYLDRIGAGLAAMRSTGLAPLRADELKNARRLEEPLKLLADLADAEKQTRFWKLDDFRNPQVKFESNPHRVNIWHYLRVEQPRLERKIGYSADLTTVTTTRLVGRRAARALVEALHKGSSVKLLMGDPGSRRGAISSILARAYEEKYSTLGAGRVVVVNGSFATDTDSIFGILSGAFDGDTARKARMSRARATLILRSQIEKQLLARLRAETEQLFLARRRNWTDQQFLASLDDARRHDVEMTLIINGMERFFAHDGSALSTELDYLIRFVFAAEKEHFAAAREYRARHYDAATDPAVGYRPPAFPVRLILLGTPRLQRYLSIVAPDHDLIPIATDRTGAASEFKIADSIFSVTNEPFFTKLKEHFPAVAAPVGGDRSARRRSFLGDVFNSITQPGSGITNPDLALKILTVLAFIGQPTEEHVLCHVPGLWGSNRLTRKCQHRIRRAVRQLIAKNLLLKIERFPTHQTDRLGLHKSLIMELRQRHGVPVSDAKLASGFNIGLYTAQPVDNSTPDQRWHNEIGQMVDFLAGQYKDEQSVDRRIEVAAKAAVAAGAAVGPLHDYNEETLARLASPAMADCLRAALSLMRSYYSTSALLMRGNRDLDPWSRDGPLTEHAERLTRLIRIAQIVAAARRLVTDELRKTLTGAEVIRILGPASFYPDDLVWLNNELGLVWTTQGSLFGARAALEEAHFVNDTFVDFGERHQNWRRISMNLVQVDIDSGQIEAAEERLRDIETALEAQADLLTRPPGQLPGATFGSLKDYVATVYAHSDCSLRTGRVDAYYPTNLILGVALVLGYSGLCQHLRGALEPADEMFKDALAILERLQEYRAYSFFQRHRASLFAASKKMIEAEEALRLCIAAAGPSRQTDIDHSGRIALAQYGILIPAADEREGRRRVIPQLTETLRYATTSDMFRLQLEAMQNIAFVHLNNGDADSAMVFATDALAIATRCGFGLRKVSLRMLVGKILVFRRNREAGRKLLLTASEIATKLGYQRAVEGAEDALVQLQ